MTTTAIVIVHGPMGSGKTRHAKALLKYFGCSRLVDGWCGRAPLAAGDLALTTLNPPFRAKGATIVEISTALARIAVANGRVRAGETP